MHRPLTTHGQVKGKQQDSSLAVTLTVAELRDVIRQEVTLVFLNHAATPIKSAKPYLAVKEAAEFARIAPSTIRLYIRKRQLRAQNVGRRVIIAATELENFLSRNAIAAREG
jgi:excisionase family DNA binding protein